MKRIIFIFISILALFANAQDINTMEILFKDGMKAQLAFNSIPKIQFTEDAFVVISVDETFKLPIDDVAKYYFLDNSNSMNLDSTETHVGMLKYYNGKIICQGFGDDSTLVIADISGRIVTENKLTQSSNIIDISAFAKGVYVVSVDNTTIKILKQ